MATFVHRRNTPAGPRYRVWSTVVDAYETAPLTREDAIAYLLERDRGAAERAVAERIAGADAKGTSSRLGDTRDPDGPWDTERCEDWSGGGKGCGRFHHAFVPSEPERHTQDCKWCGEPEGERHHGPPCFPRETYDDADGRPPFIPRGSLIVRNADGTASAIDRDGERTPVALERSAEGLLVRALGAQGDETWWHDRPPARGDLLRDLRDGRVGTFTGEVKTSWPPQFVVESGGDPWGIPARRCALVARRAVDEGHARACEFCGAVSVFVDDPGDAWTCLKCGGVAGLGPLPTHVETIATAAIRVDGEVWTLPRPARHHVLIQAWAIAHYRDGEEGRIGEHDQGFVTSTGRFVEREEAKVIARAAGRLLERASSSASLFSEDVW